MRAGRLLDGFPLHLLTGRAGAISVVLDSDALGRVQTSPGSASTEVGAGEGCTVALARDAAVLRETRDGWDENLGRRPWLVRADPERPPFRDGCIGGVLGIGDAPTCWRELLCAGAWRMSIDPASHFGRPEGALDAAAHSGRREYFIRPACDREYFATRTWSAADWPFGALQLGRLRALRLAANRWTGRSGIARLYDGARVRIARSGSDDALAPVEALCGAGADGFGLFAKVAWNALLLGVDGGRRIAKFPLNGVASARMHEQADHLAGLFGPDEPLAAHVPRLTAHGSIGGQEYWMETMCPGVPATKVPLLPRRAGWGVRWKRRAARQGVEFLVALHGETAEMTSISKDLFEHFMKPRVEAVTRDCRRLDPGFDLAQLSALLWAALSGREVPLVRTHGDFWPGNVLVDPRAELCGVLDWDASEPQGWPLLDLLHFIAFQQKRRAFWHFGPTLSKRVEPRRLPAWELELADAYCHRLGIAGDLWTPFVVLYWLERVSQWLVTDFHEGKRNDAWLRRNVLRTAPLLDAALRRTPSRG